MPTDTLRGEVALGHGVTATAGDDGSWTVTSLELRLGWEPRGGSLPGTAVAWHDRLWEVVAGGAGDAGECWRLEPWPEGEAARVVATLTDDRVATAAADAEAQRRQRRARGLSVALLPLTGAMPRWLQRRWQRDFGHPAVRATFVSAAVEALLGATGVAQLATVMAGGPWLVPPVLRWAVLLGPVLLLEGLIRLWFTSVQEEPMGAMATAPLVLLEPAPPSAPPAQGCRPAVVREAPDGSELVLATEEPRGDWRPGGVLHFRDRPWRLRERAPGGGRVVYLFEAAEPGSPATLRLAAPPPPGPPTAAPGEPSLGALILRNLLFAFAPQDLQRAWFGSRGTPVMLPTLATGAVEAFGGVVNLLDGSPAGLLHLLDLFFVVEGVARIALAVGGGGPVGSLLALPFLPLLRRWV
jgi:hypothetical protein